MVDHDAYEAMEALMDEVGESLGLDGEDYIDQARDVYEYLGAPGGNIKLIGRKEPGLYGDTEDSLAAWDDDNLICSYGIDASTTQEQDFSNGLRILVANAKAGVIGKGHQSIADESHIVTGVYDHDEETNLETKRFKDTETVRADLRVMSKTDPDRARRLVKSITRCLSEGQHLNRVVEAIDESELYGPIFVDGPIYPAMIFPEVRARYHGGADDAWTDVFGETVGNYISAATWSLETGWPIIGIVKDMDTTSLITDLKQNVDQFGPNDTEIPWSKDKQFLTDLLQTDDNGTYIYTDWFVETECYCHNTDSDGNEFVEPFEGSPHCEKPLEQYHKAFFYVHNPRTDTIMRIETPHGLITNGDSRDYIQNRALAEIAKTGDSAEAILRADTEARISRQNENRLFSKIYSQMQSVRSYNHDYRGPEYIGGDN